MPTYTADLLKCSVSSADLQTAIVNLHTADRRRSADTTTCTKPPSLSGRLLLCGLVLGVRTGLERLSREGSTAKSAGPGVSIARPLESQPASVAGLLYLIIVLGAIVRLRVGGTLLVAAGDQEEIANFRPDAAPAKNGECSPARQLLPGGPVSQEL
jgi:hypothetical protein